MSALLALAQVLQLRRRRANDAVEGAQAIATWEMKRDCAVRRNSAERSRRMTMGTSGWVRFGPTGSWEQTYYSQVIYEKPGKRVGRQGGRRLTGPKKQMPVDLLCQPAPHSTFRVLSSLSWFAFRSGELKLPSPI